MGDKPPAAIFTNNQREYLTGKSEPAQERTMKTRIRERVNIAITIDVPLLNIAIKEGALDPEQIIDSVSMNELVRVLGDQVELIYLLARAGDLSGEKVIEKGIKAAQSNRADELFEEFRDDPTSMTFHQLSFLKETGRINETELLEAFRQNPQQSGAGITSPKDIDEIRQALAEAGYLDDDE